MRSTRLFAAFAALLFFTTAAEAGPLPIDIKLVNVPLIPQQTNVWCWAASGQMVMKYCGINHSQCQQATYQFGQAAGVNCCTSPTPSACISGGHVEILHYGFTAQQLGNMQWLSGSQIENQIANQHMPWIINPHSPGWGHVIVGVGYLAINGQVLLVAINDPWPPNVGAFYWESLAFYQCGGWNGNCHTEGYDFYNIKPPPLKLPKFPLLVSEKQLVLPPPEVDRAFAGDPDPLKAAAAALPLLAEAVNADTAPRLGVESGERLKGAVLGKPVEQFTVPLDRLRAFKPGGRLDALLVRAPALLVPVGAGGRAQAVMHLQFDGKNWKFASFGAPAVAEAWERASRAGAEFFVQVDGLEETFGGRRSGGRLMLTPLFANRDLGLEPGRERPADDVFAALVAPANAHRPNILGGR